MFIETHHMIIRNSKLNENNIGIDENEIICSI